MIYLIFKHSDSYLLIDYSKFLKNEEKNMEYILLELGNNKKIGDKIWSKTLSQYGKEELNIIDKLYKGSKDAVYRDKKYHLLIKNIDSSNLDFLQDLNRVFNFKYYDFKFNNFNKDYYKVFNFIKNKDYIKELNIEIKGKNKDSDLKIFFNKIKENFQIERVYPDGIMYNVHSSKFIGNDKIFK